MPWRWGPCWQPGYTIFGLVGFRFLIDVFLLLFIIYFIFKFLKNPPRNFQIQQNEENQKLKEEINRLKATIEELKSKLENTNETKR